MNRRALALAFAFGLCAPVLPVDALAQAVPATDAVRAEARDRFDRGLRLFNAGDNAGALVEFKRAYDLVENVVVLYNIGLVYAQMGRTVEATDVLDRVLAKPGALSPDRLALARRTRDDQASRIAEVTVQANVDSARVEIDGIEAGKTPVAAPLRLTSGTHVIGVVAPGYSPQRKEVAIAGGEKQAITFELVAMQGRIAHLNLKTHLPGADLFVDDQRIGSTPLTASVSLSPGAHRIELRRTGYTTASTDITLGDGALGEVALEPVEDPAAPSTSLGTMELDVSETLPVVTIDGRPRGVYATPLRVLAGPHHLLVERGDFAPFERDVTVDAGRTTTVHVVLEPTPEYRTAFSSRARAQRTWGIIGIIGGAVVLAGGAGLVVYDAAQRTDGQSTQNAISILSVRGQMKACDPGGDQSSPAYQTQCIDPLNAASAKIHDADTRDYVGWVAVGIGAAGAALGVALLVTADDPHKYDHQSKAATVAGTPSRIVPTFWTTRGGGGVAVAGSF